MIEWFLYAHECADGEFEHVDYQPRVVTAYGPDRPVVAVRAIQDDDGTYYGWIPTGEAYPRMIQPRWSMYAMQFPYGVKVEVAHNKGRTVAMRIERA